MFTAEQRIGGCGGEYRSGDSRLVGCGTIKATVPVFLAGGESKVEALLPHLPGGPHFIDVWLRSADGEVLDWFATSVRVKQEISVAVVELDKPSFSAGATVSGKVMVKGVPPENATLRISLFEGFGRVLAEDRDDLSDPQVPFAFSFRWAIWSNPCSLPV